jgi:hypothetical protein
MEVVHGRGILRDVRRFSAYAYSIPIGGIMGFMDAVVNISVTAIGAVLLWKMWSTAERKN